MTQILRPGDLGTDLDEIRSRLRILESTSRLPGGVLNSVAQANATQNVNYVTDGVNYADVQMDRLDTFDVVSTPRRFLVVASTFAKTSGATGFYAYVDLSVRSGPTQASEVTIWQGGLWDKGLAGYYAFTTMRWVELGQLGSAYNVRPKVKGDSGQTLNLYTCHIDVYALGA